VRGHPANAFCTCPWHLADGLIATTSEPPAAEPAPAAAPAPAEPVEETKAAPEAPATTTEAKDEAAPGKPRTPLYS
jgi:hypothetical protein